MEKKSRFVRENTGSGQTSGSVRVHNILSHNITYHHHPEKLAAAAGGLKKLEAICPFFIENGRWPPSNVSPAYAGKSA